MHLLKYLTSTSIYISNQDTCDFLINVHIYQEITSILVTYINTCTYILTVNTHMVMYDCK